MFTRSRTAPSQSITFADACRPMAQASDGTVTFLDPPPHLTNQEREQLDRLAANFARPGGRQARKKGMLSVGRAIVARALGRPSDAAVAEADDDELDDADDAEDVLDDEDDEDLDDDDHSDQDRERPRVRPAAHTPITGGKQMPRTVHAVPTGKAAIAEF